MSKFRYAYRALDYLEKICNEYQCGTSLEDIRKAVDEDMQERRNTYTEILMLDRYLTTENIPHAIQEVFDGWLVFYPDKETRICEVCEFTGSRGAKNNRLEITGLWTKEENDFSYVGELSADEVYDRIKKHYEKHKKDN